jgi:uncharacterized protein with HEPN domain
MHPQSPKLLEDIRDAAAFIGEVTKGKSLTDYSADRLLRQAIERNFEIHRDFAGFAAVKE